MGPALPWIALVFTVGSTAYQYQQQKKARKKAKAEAEARKGFELVIEGSPGVLPIIYGKAKVGGVRAFHNTSSNFNYTTSNANKTFNINLGYSRSGEKNEFLIFQQAICQGGISSVKDIVINETQFLNDPVLYDNAGIRVDVHFSGGVVDPLLKANAPDRSTALFTNIAYANIYVKLNRDDPQFGGVPDIQFLVEGRKVRKVLNGILQTTYVYSNNPAWVLLDYLLEFRKVPIEDIILSSFEQAAALADTIKLTGATVGGNFYRPALVAETLFGRDIPLYETNIALDSAKPFRENVEAILETMGDARLVWSQGKYKLNAQYPGLNNENIVISDYITDDDLVLGKPITINWPSAEERLNNVTVRFNNESENFKEDTVSWPNKPNSSYTRGIGGFVYPAVSGWDTSSGGRLLNAYGVWNKGSNTANLVYKVKAKVTGDHVFRFTADDSVSGSVSEYTFHPNAWTLYLNNQPTGTSRLERALSGSSWRSVKTETIFLEAGKVYEIKLNASNNKDIKGIAATLTDPSNVVIWTTREPSYAGFEEISSDNAAYLAMLAEDNNVELETDVFLQGTTDYYHAKAKAEELVRTSRTAFSIKFTYIAKDKYLEPGDVIQLSSENIQMGLEGPLYVRVSSISLKPDFQCEIQGTRFDGTQLAWNVADNEYLKPISSYSEELPAPYYLEYTPDANDIHNGPGSLNWPPVDDSRIISYNLYMHKEGEVDAGGNNLFKKIGSTPNPPFGLPDLLEEDLIFGIKSVANTGRMSKMTVTNLVNLVRATPPAPFNVTAMAYGDRNQSVKITWEIPLDRPDGSIYNNHSVTFIYRSKVNDIALAQKIGESLQSTEYIDTPSEFGTLYYWVKFISYAGVQGAVSDPVSLEVDFWQVFVDDLFKPPAPTNLEASGVVNSIILTWDQTTYSGGGGHDYAVIYGQKWPDGTIEPVFSYDTVISTVKDAKIYRHTVEPGERWVYWVKEKSRNSGLSDGYAGPAVATTEYDPAKLVSALSGHISKSTLSAELQAEIESVDALAIQAVSNKVDDIYGSYTVKIDHNNHISGYGLASEANDGTPISSFIVAADSFAIGAPTVANGDFNLNNQYPFIHLSTPTVVDGVTIEPGTYLKRAFLADATITDAKIVTLNAEKITTGYLNAERLRAGSIDASKINSRGLSIYDEAGNVILAAGSGLEGINWDYVKGAAKPQDGATRNVYVGSWTLGSGYLKGDIVQYEGNGWSALENHTATILNAPPETGMSNTFWTLHSLRGEPGEAGLPGVNGTRTAILDMYKWAAEQPTSGFPSGTSTYTWATAQFTSPSTSNGWELVPPAPVLGQTLWMVRQLYSDQQTSSQTVIGWTANVATPAGASGPQGPIGVPGTRTGVLELYKWAQTTPTTFPQGTSTYTWNTGSFNLPATPNGWTLLPGAPIAGYILWACSERIVDNTIDPTSNKNWSTVTAYAIGGSGANAISALIDNESHSCPSSADGTTVNYANSGCKITVFEGTTPLVFSTGTLSAGQFSVGTPIVSPTGKLIVGARSGSGTTAATVAQHSAFLSDTDVVTITYPLTVRRLDGTNTSISKIQTITKSKAGVAGAGIIVTPNRAPTFTSTDNIVDPDQSPIVFTALAEGFTNPSYAWSFARNGGTGTAPTASTSNTYTITQANLGSSKSATVTCTVNGSNADTYTIVLLERSTAGAGATAGASLTGSFGNWDIGAQTIVTVSDGKVGSTALRLGTTVSHPIYKTFIAIDSTKKYRTRFWARPSATCNGLLYFSLRQSLNNAGSWGPTNGGRAPYKPSAKSVSEHNTEFGAGQWGEYSFIWTAADWQTGVRFVVPEFLHNYDGTEGYWEIQDFILEDATQVELAKESAAAAEVILANFSADNMLSSIEKKEVLRKVDAIIAEGTAINNQGAAFGITTSRTNYVDAYNSLIAYVTPLLSDMTSATPIDRLAFRNAFSLYYNRRELLLNDTAFASAQYANWAGVSGTGKPQDGATVGATIGTNLGGQFTQASWDAYISTVKIGAANIGAVALTGNSSFSVIGTNTGGNYMDMNARRIKIYNNGVLRVQLGDLTA